MLTAFAAYPKACKATEQRESGGANRGRQGLTKQQTSLVIDASRAALLIIDVQKAIDAAYHAADGARNNPGAESNIARLLAIWRGNERPIIHIRHDSTFPASAFRPGQEGNQFKDEVAPRPGEKIVPKRTNSAFIGTDLERYLRDAGLETLVVTGVSTNNSVEATVRMSGNLGFRTYLVEDACCTFGRRDFSGRLRTAEEVHAMSLANLHGEYCTVVNTAGLLVIQGVVEF
jgi:nicotinamidase-related amidase